MGKKFIIKGYDSETEFSGRYHDGQPVSRSIVNIFVALPIFVGLVFFILGIYLSVSSFKYKIICKEPVDAIVVEIVQNKTESHSDEATFAPVYSFNYNGKSYEVVSNVFQSPCPVKVGDSLELFINADNPYQIYDPERKKMGFIGIGICIFGLLFLLFFGIKTLKAILLHKKNKLEYIG